MKMKVFEFYEPANPACAEVHSLLSSFANIEVIRVNVEDEKSLELIDKFNVCMVPTIIFSEQPRIQITGVPSEHTIEDLIEQAKFFK